MDKPLSILLVEDEPMECTAMVEYIESTEDVRLVQVTNNANKALEHVVDYLPDAIILDLELHKGGGNGIIFLKALKKAPPKIFPYILVTTNNISSITHKQIRQLGVDFIMLKSQDDYSAENVIEFLRAFKGTIQASRKKNQEEDKYEEVPPAERKRRIEIQITTEMDLIGISPGVKGRRYLIDAIILIVDELDEQTQDITATIAERYSKSTPSVERAMQNAISNAWKHSDIEDLKRYYTARIRSDKGVPTLTEFMHYYANKIKQTQ